MRPSMILLALTASLTLACGPLAMIPGGEIDGTLRPPPANWSFTDAHDDVVLETNPSDPYSVTVWGVAVGDRFYIAAGNKGNQWAENIRQDPRVRLKVGDDLFELNAIATDESDDLEAFLGAVKKKYEFEPDAEQRSDSELFRLEAR